jgi:peptide/nickel transport system substrate-binding protein
MRKILHSFIGASFAIALSASANAESVLKVSVHADLKNIDPIWTTALITANHGYAIYDTLFAVDGDFNMQPQMAESYTVSDDGLVYTIKLRAGLKWHDGAPVTAADCVASIARWGKRDGLGQRLMKRMDKMEAVDAGTIKLTLKEPFGATILALGKDMSNVPFMMPERIAKTDAHKQIEEMTGSGPFKIVKDKWVPGSKVIYTKNPDYVARNEPASNFAGGKVVNFDRLEWHYIPDASTALNALQAGEIDLIENLAADLVPVAKGAEGVTVETTDALGWQPWLVINHLHPPFNNIKARQALQWMVDQATYQRANSSIPNSWRTCPSFFICDTPYGSEVGAERVMQQNFDTAKKLLKEAGYKGEKVVLLHPTDIPQLHSASLVTANLLRKIGINVDDQAMDWSTVTSRRAEKKKPSEGGWNIFHTAWPAKMLMNPMLHYGVAGTCDKAWFGWPCDEKLQALGKQFANEGDPKKLMELSVKMQGRAMEYVTYIPLGQYFFFRAYRSDLSGVIPSVASFFWNIKRN